MEHKNLIERNIIDNLLEIQMVPSFPSEIICCDREQVNNFLETKLHPYLNWVSFVFIIMIMQCVTAAWSTVINEYVLMGIC